MEILSSRGVDLIPINKRSIRNEPDIILQLDDESSSSDDVQHISSIPAAITKPLNAIHEIRSKLQSNTIVNSFEPEQIEVEPELVALDEDDDYYNDEMNQNGYNQDEQDTDGNYGNYIYTKLFCLP